MANKFCSNCKYYELFDDEEPCLTCDGDNGRHINWRPSGSGDPEPDALDAARRAGRAEGLREAAEITRVLVGGIGGHPMVDALLARAEEVERG